MPPSNACIGLEFFRHSLSLQNCGQSLKQVHAAHVQPSHPPGLQVWAASACHDGAHGLLWARSSACCKGCSDGFDQCEFLPRACSSSHEPKAPAFFTPSFLSPCPLCWPVDRCHHVTMSPCHHVPSAGLSIVALSTERAFAAHCSGNKPITWMFKSAYGSRPCPHPFLATAVSLCGACAPLQPPSALCAHSPQCHSEERKDWRRYMCSNLCIVSQTFALVDHVQHAYACTCTHDTLSNAGACHPFSSWLVSQVWLVNGTSALRKAKYHEWPVFLVGPKKY